MFGALGGLVQGSQQVAALEEVQVALQRDVDLAVVAGQLRQAGGLEGRAQQTTGDAWKTPSRRENIWDFSSESMTKTWFKKRFFFFFLEISM